MASIKLLSHYVLNQEISNRGTYTIYIFIILNTWLIYSNHVLLCVSNKLQLEEILKIKYMNIAVGQNDKNESLWQIKLGKKWMSIEWL